MIESKEGVKHFDILNKSGNADSLALHFLDPREGHIMYCRTMCMHEWVME